MTDRPSRLRPSLDVLAAAPPGIHHGMLRLNHSDDRHAFALVPIPLSVIVGAAPGPVLLLVAGNHGDEYEGQAALLGLLHTAEPALLAGRIIVMPALNLPAVAAGRRVSPLDGGNMNRAFPGDPDGGPTAQIAHWLDSALLAHVDAVVDLHSGGRASLYWPVAMATRAAADLALARAFGVPDLLLLGAMNDPRSLNAAAARRGTAMIAVELGGGGFIDRARLAQARAGIAGVLRHLGMSGTGPAPLATLATYEIGDTTAYLTAPAAGLFEPLAEIGQTVAAGRPMARLMFWNEPERPPLTLAAPRDGLVMARSARAQVERGDHLYVVLRPAAV